MRRIFVVHSPITYLLALSIIDKEKLELSDCLLLSVRELIFQTPVPVRSIAKRKWEKIKLAGLVDNEIAGFVKDDCFIAYFPVMCNLAKLLVTNKKCIKFHFFEEGQEAYQKDIPLESICEFSRYSWRYCTMKEFMTGAKIMCGLLLEGLTLKTLSLPFNYVAYAFNKERKFYCLNDLAFPLASNKILVSLPQMMKRFHFNTKYDLNNAFIWVSSSVFDHFPDKQALCTQVLSHTIIPFLSEKRVSKLYVKFRQCESRKSMRSFLSILDDYKINYQIIDPSAILEIELAAANNVTLLGDISSLLFYNVMFGHKSYSVMNKMENNFYKTTDSYMEVYMNGITML